MGSTNNCRNYRAVEEKLDFCVVVAMENALEYTETDRRLLENTAGVFQEKNTPILESRTPRYEKMDKVFKFCAAQFAYTRISR